MSTYEAVEGPHEARRRNRPEQPQLVEMPEEGGLQQLDHPDKRFVTHRAVPGAHRLYGRAAANHRVSPTGESFGGFSSRRTRNRGAFLEPIGKSDISDSLNGRTPHC